MKIQDVLTDEKVQRIMDAAMTPADIRNEIDQIDRKIRKNYLDSEKNDSAMMDRRCKLVSMLQRKGN